MNNLIKNLDEINQDLNKFSNISHNDFLTLMVKVRIEDQTKKYDKEFDRIISWIESSTLNITTDELSKTFEYLKLYSKTIELLYSKLIDRVTLFNNLL